MNTILVHSTNNKNISSVLFITENMDCINKLKNNLSDKYNISFFNDNKFYLLSGEINSFDLIVFDNRKNTLLEFIEVFKSTKTYDFNVPMIVLEDEIKEKVLTYKYCNTYMILNESIDEKSLLINIELSLSFLCANKKVQFENGFYFDVNKEILFQGKKIIKLTKTEKKLVNLLASNPNVLITYEDISSVVWKGKEFSIYSLRNVIKHIREKTDETFIKNSSNRGYVINTI